MLLAVGLMGALRIHAEEDGGTHFFVQPGLVIVPGGEDFKDTTGLTIETGVAFSKHHSLELEGIYFDRKSDVPWKRLELDYIIGLATYKYAFRFRHGISVFAGGSIGKVYEYTSDYFSIIQWGGGLASQGPKSDSAFAYGFSGGVSYSLNPKIHFEAGGRLIHMGKTYFTTSGGIVMLQGSVRFQF